MSIILDKGRFKLIYESDNKSKTNYSLSKKTSKNQNQAKQPQAHLLKTYIGLSPNNIQKKKPYLKNYNNSTLNQGHYYKNLNKKNIHSKNLKYNRSFEGGLIKNEFTSNNNDMNANNKNISNNQLYIFNDTYKDKNKSNPKINKTHVFSSGTKSKTNNNKINNKTNNNIIKRLDEKFKSLENNIIDKKYENDIDHDEMIITTNRKTDDKSKSNESKTFNNYLYNIININNNNFYNIDENLMNSSFENNKNDFNIMYVENYASTVPSDMLILEIKLIFEKILELQKSYHRELDNILYHYFINKKEYKHIINKYNNIQKKTSLFIKIKEEKNRKENQNCFNIYHKKNFQNINDINKSEFQLWKIMMNSENENKDNKNKLKEIFTISVFEKFNKIKKFTDIEKKIILNLMKKNKFILKDENETNKVKNNKSNNSLKKYNNKKILSPISYNKNIVIFSKSSNKIKHKKIMSISSKGKKY